MPTAAEIADRIRKADQDRIERRATAAANVATLASELDTLQAKVTEVRKKLGTATVLAVEVMSLQELADFIERGGSEINDWAAAGGIPPAKRIKPGPRRGKSTNRKKAASSNVATRREAPDVVDVVDATDEADASRNEAAPSAAPVHVQQ
jgi:hypothetical protein